MDEGESGVLNHGWYCNFSGIKGFRRFQIKKPSRIVAGFEFIGHFLNSGASKHRIGNNSGYPFKLGPGKAIPEKILTPHARSTKSYILDTGDFLNKIHSIKNIPPDSTLCTLDVNSLYTSIEHDKGVEAVILTLREANMDSNLLDLCIDLLNLVLRENFFIFEDDFFLQTCGTAMGSNVAPAYANLYMDHFERTYVYPNPIFQQHAITWYRYIDDIFCIWRGDQTSLQGFFNTINEARPGLTFTLVQHSEEIAFLDTKILKDTSGNLSTDLFVKPTDCNSLLLYNSCHPRPTRDSLPRSQFKRVARIVSDPMLRSTRVQEMADKFKARNYPTRLLDLESSKALNTTEVAVPTMVKNPRLPFVHNHHPTMHRIHNLIRGHWPLLSKAYPHIPIFRDPPLMSMRRPQNVRDRVVRADLGTSRTPTLGTLSGQRRTAPFVNKATGWPKRCKAPFVNKATGWPKR
ncbi:unnamed protein product [Ranitomeya imitator]|uniref:Reverse transcriptase domain-containing protein n=1 Tax=Ranitomeya imitator TaxID=111125 RepID=A0ABN9LPY8_9NEOB|nr:unnamed protein product [Ranitomeya imitator]